MPFLPFTAGDGVSGDISLSISAWDTKHKTIGSLDQKINLKRSDIDDTSRLVLEWGGGDKRFNGDGEYNGDGALGDGALGDDDEVKFVETNGFSTAKFAGRARRGS